jgi:uncharacterized protein YcbX
MHLSELNIYPIKSCRGISLAEAVVEERGLQFDRRWMLVDENNRFLTQREYPVMATIRASVDNGQLIVNNGGNSIEIDPAKTQSRKERVTVWNSEVKATVYESEVSEFFSDILGASVRLAHMTDEDRRAVNPRFDRGHDIVSFADGYPLMALGEATLQDLNQRIIADAGGRADDGVRAPLPMDRFRPNFVISGSEAHAEDNWLRVRIGGVAFRSTKPCERCVITTVDQARGEFDGKDPLKTLATYRLAKDVMPDRIEALGVSPNGVLFGQNLIAETAGAMIKVGDEVEVIETY